MDRHEVVNRALMPLDEVLDAGIEALRARGLYDPLKRTVQDGVRAVLARTLRVQHRIEVLGAENLPDTGGCVIAANHQSWLDVQVLAVATRRRLTFVAKADFQDTPVLRHLMELDEALYVRGGDHQALDRVAQAVEQGCAVVMFPEGAIPGNGDTPRWDVEPDTGLLPGRSGVVRVAMTTGCPVVPCGISGTGRAFPPEAYPRMDAWPPVSRGGRITVRFGPPLTFRRGPGELTREDLADRTKGLMRAISTLVDPGRSYVPQTLPVAPRAESDRVPPMAWTNRPRARRAKAPLGVLVLPGFAANARSVEPLVRPLDDLGVPYRVPELTGQGGPWKDLAEVTPADWFRDAEDALLDLCRDADRVAIVGASTGALVGLEVAAKHRAQVAGIATLGAPLRFADPWARWAPTLAKVSSSRPAPVLFSDPTRCRAASGVHPRLPARLTADLARYGRDVTRLLSFVKAPLLVVQSHGDAVADEASARILQGKVSSRDRSVVWLADSGHELLRDGEGDRVVAEVLAFLKRLG